jgi:predicted ATPase
MRIAFSGAANTGKTTIIKSFLYTWNSYRTPSKTYRDIINDKNLSHSSNTTIETQTVILDALIDQVQGYALEDNIVHDRCPLDALAYSMWCNGKGIDGFDNEYIKKQITLTKESMRFLDIIFICKYNESEGVNNNGLREANEEYIKEVDNIFESLFQQYTQNLEADIFFPKNDSPFLIKLPHNPQSRIDLISEYVTPDGSMYGEEESILNPAKINELESLVMQQKAAYEVEEAEKALFKKFGLS